MSFIDLASNLQVSFYKIVKVNDNDLKARLYELEKTFMKQKHFKIICRLAYDGYYKPQLKLFFQL